MLRLHLLISLSTQILEAQQEHDSPNDVALEVLAVLINACADVGVEAREVLADKPAAPEEGEVEGARNELEKSTLE